MIALASLTQQLLKRYTPNKAADRFDNTDASEISELRRPKNENSVATNIAPLTEHTSNKRILLTSDITFDVKAADILDQYVSNTAKKTSQIIEEARPSRLVFLFINYELDT